MVRLVNFLIFFIFTFLCTSCLHENVHQIINNLSIEDSDIPIRWNKYTPPPSPWAEAKTIGDLELLLSNGARADLPMKGDILNRLPIDALEMATSESEEERLIARLAAINKLLKHGASPQRMTQNALTSEAEYALFIKYGLDATAPVMYGNNEIQYPLTRRQDFITYPIAKHLLENGANPNQVEIVNSQEQTGELLTPLSKVTYKPPFLLHEAAYYNKYRSGTQVHELQELLKRYGATK